jgi:hypothetical protein
MNTYAIRRSAAWPSADDLEKAGERSTQVAADEFPDDIAWIRSYVVAEEDGSLGSICIYQATDSESVRKHAERAGMPADEVVEVVDTVIVRPDPEPAAAD